MRIAIGGVSHETNTFCAGLTEVADFRRAAWETGDEIIAAHTGVRDDFGGMLEAADRLGVEIVPTFASGDRAERHDLAGRPSRRCATKSSAPSRRRCRWTLFALRCMALA